MQRTQVAHEYCGFFLSGPTAVGKSAVAQFLAETHNFDMLSCDSMLVYRGMDIGTAKPTASEREKVHYWGVDVVSPSKSFSVADYHKVALKAFSSVLGAGRKLLVVGGTGLYMKSLIYGLDSKPPANPMIRLKAERLLRTSGIQALQEWLRALSPIAYNSLADPENPRRLVRAIECVMAQSPAPCKQRKSSAHKTARIPALILQAGELSTRIKSRVRKMFSSGFVEEVEYLLKKFNFESSPTASQAIGYSEVIDYLRGRCSREEAIQKTIIRTGQLAKRQRTWLSHQVNVGWLHIDKSMSVSMIGRQVLDYWHVHGPTPIL